MPACGGVGQRGGAAGPAGADFDCGAGGDFGCARVQAGVAEQLGRLGLRGKWSKEEAAEAASAGDAVLRSQRALGQVRAPDQAP